MTKYRFSKDKFIQDFESTMHKEATSHIQNIFEGLTGFLVCAYEKGLEGQNLSDTFPFLEEADDE